MKIGTEGDLGDIVFTLGVLSELPEGPHELHVEISDITKIKTREIAEKTIAMVKDLAESQPYISCVKMHDGSPLDWRSGNFRRVRGHLKDRTLLESHARNYQQHTGSRQPFTGQKPWLKVDPLNTLKGMIAINRTARYNNWMFQWKRIVQHYGHRLVFLGSPVEYFAFCEEFGPVGYISTETLLEAARLIAGADLYIGNQSVCNALAEGMKRPLIQETCISLPDCVWHRENAQYVADGACVLPDVSGSGELVIESQVKDILEEDYPEVPPGGWTWHGEKVGNRFDVVVKLAMKEAESRKDAIKAIVDENRLRIPEYFTKRQPYVFGIVDAAKANAKRIAGVQ